ncbi:Nucleoid occlusion protein (plasmid) [Streptomyces sp. ADI95-16]|uniref:ParB/RepB/Spo0J family partition protein n=1 Tax=Streptomyces sp. ADI95-16 TaxID=1522758 RepID=UPI000F3A8E6C|nr:ParB/RepB/Spo0J family partition protein [Streptomyces sp. ADI95-16]AYV32943.1 Nucleoid occlusion protein [Streptomyces sp. ADI95-16]
MSKADMLGDSPTFDAVAQPMSSRAASFARFSGQETEPAVGRQETLRMPVEGLAHNPFNPRVELRSIDELADSVASRGIIQPLTVVTRLAFLDAHPGQSELGRAAFVVVDGNRRLAAARLAGLDDVPVHVDDSLAESADILLETALTAAVQHESLDPLDEAKALARLVEVHGSQRAVARALGKSSPWVTQRIALLKLTPELQAAVEDRSLPVEIARNVGQLPAQQQKDAVQEALEKRAQTKERKRAQTAKGANAVSTPPTDAGVDVPEQVSTPVRILPPTSDASSVASDVPRVLQPASPQVQSPWDDGNKVADLVFEKMSASQREVLLERLLAAQGRD